MTQTCSPSLHLSVSPSLRLSVSPSLRLSVSQSLSLSISPSLHLSIPPSLCPSVPPSLSPSVSQSLSLSIPLSLSPSVPQSLRPPLPTLAVKKILTQIVPTSQTLKTPILHFQFYMLNRLTQPHLHCKAFLNPPYHPFQILLRHIRTAGQTEPLVK
jgi:hypothetical protein